MTRFAREQILRSASFRQDLPRSAILVHRVTKLEILEAPLNAGKDLRQKTVLENAKKDFHRVYHGWYSGLRESGWDVALVDRPSYLVPDSIVMYDPDLYLRLLAISASKFKLIDTFVFWLWLRLMLLTVRPRFILFSYDTLPEDLRRLCQDRGIKTLSYFGVVPSLKPAQVKGRVASYDFVISGYELPKLWPQIGHKFYRLMLGPSKHSAYVKHDTQEKDIDVCLIGGYGGSLFEERARLADEILGRLDGHQVRFKIYGYALDRNLGQKYPRLHQSLLGRLYGDQYYDSIRRSKIIITVPSDAHIEIGATRPQGVFEPAASKTFQIAYNTRDTGDIFDPGTEIALFDSIDELADKIQYYLAHEAEREQIAMNAHMRFLRDYVGERLIEQMVTDLHL